MTPKHKRNKEYNGNKNNPIVGIYRVVKSIEEKVEAILDEMRDSFGDGEDEHYPRHFWDDAPENGF